jgi:hypothetical protein
MIVRQVLSRLFAPTLCGRAGLVAARFSKEPPKKDAKEQKPVDEDDEDDDGRKTRAEEEN